MAKRKTEFGKYVLEATIVAFGVVLGILLTDWNAQRKVNQHVEQTLDYMIIELESNIIKLQASADYHETITKEVDSLLSNMPPEVTETTVLDNKYFNLSMINSWRGIGTANPEFIMYESAQISGVFQELNISSIRTIANAYERLSTYRKFSESTLDLLISLDSESKLSDLLRIFDIIRGDISGFELILIEEMQMAIDELKKAKETKSYKK